MRIVKSGIATLQDLGRFGYRNFGVSHGGVMDSSAARLTNMLVANPVDATLIEIAAGAFSMSSTKSQLIALGGRGFNAFAGEQPLPFWQPLMLPAGETLRLIPAGGGIAYIAIHGGIRTTPVLGSRNTNLVAGFGGIEGRPLRPGDMLPVAVLKTEVGEKIIRQLSEPAQHSHLRLSGNVIPDYSINTIRFFTGHHYSSFTPAARILLESDTFELTGMSNRMGYRFNGAALQNMFHTELISAAVVPGTMQVSPDGQLLILMADAQTTGGYPCIGQVIGADIPLLAQHGAGSRLQFKCIALNEAERILLEREANFRTLQKDYEMHFA